MKAIHIHSSSHSYSIFMEEKIRFQIAELLDKKYSSVFIITDSNVAPLYLDDVKQCFHSIKTYTEVIPAGEQSKSMASFYQLHTKALQFGLDRNALIIALGGGVVGDLAGFVAATFMRGIEYIQIPTTILAHDSSVGGKVAINHELGKNLIGSFYPPAMVIYDVETLHTLSPKEIRSGYAELLKEALLGDAHFLKDILQTNLSVLDNETLRQHLYKGVNIKASIVEQDERENNVRKYLNLGHTLGHALETTLGYGKMTHGEAVAIGLLFAIYVSEKWLNASLPQKEIFTWLTLQAYPMKELEVDIDSILQAMKTDKKVTNQTIHMILLEKVEKPVLKEIDDTNLKQYLLAFFGELNIL
ncbi:MULTISPECIES: 3-dehydroquinate synthase [unclassified Virgibacillus]|uniref:3-dehydroquinate synthase n=1 Tax=unclassified Virgibacillus TaxID=2620237 RepID=UPI0024DE2A40|nr:3-dehydroquinate synthase [Virgibacillus sp. LDC-1]